MKNPILLAAAVCAAALVAGVPAPVSSAEAAPRGVVSQKMPKENWNDVFGDGIFDADKKESPSSSLKKKKYVGVYVSASWCGPCRAFTPELIEFYEANKDKMEIVLICADRTEDAAFSYMKKYEMPWKMAKFGAAGPQSYLRRHNVAGIPDFRVFDKNGKLLVRNGRDLDAVRKAIGGKSAKD